MCSWVAKLTTAIAAPPHIIWAAVRIIPLGSGIRALVTDPSAQPIGARSAHRAPPGLARSSPPRLSTTTPTRPRRTPASSPPETRAPKRRPKSVTHRGIVATSTDASPDDTDCSAMLTRPLPTTKNSIPVTAADPHSRARGAGSPRHRANAKRRAPATRKRAAPSKNGGKPSRATRMPKYVDPHTTQTTAKATTARRCLGLMTTP